MRYSITGNQKFYDYYKPMIDALVEAKVIEWALDPFVDGEKGTGYIWDRDKMFCYDFLKAKVQDDRGVVFAMPSFMRIMLDDMRDNPLKIPWSGA